MFSLDDVDLDFGESYGVGSSIPSIFPEVLVNAQPHGKVSQLKKISPLKGSCIRACNLNVMNDMEGCLSFGIQGNTFTSSANIIDSSDEISLNSDDTHLNKVLHVINSFDSVENSFQMPPSEPLQNNIHSISKLESKSKTHANKKALLNNSDCECQSTTSAMNWEHSGTKEDLIFKNAERVVVMEESKSQPHKEILQTCSETSILGLSCSLLNLQKIEDGNLKDQKSNKSVSSPKLPGPAGTLVKLNSRNRNFRNKLQKVKNICPVRSSPQVQASLPSQDTDVWEIARRDIGPIIWQALRKHSIASIIDMANRRELTARGKVSCLCVQLDEISAESIDARLHLKDHSGSMKGTLHREAYRSLKGHLKTGVVMVLKLVSVFSPTPKTHYLNITLPNVVQMYDSTCAILPSSPIQPRICQDQLHVWESECSVLSASSRSPSLNSNVHSHPSRMGPGIMPFQLISPQSDHRTHDDHNRSTVLVSRCYPQSHQTTSSIHELPSNPVTSATDYRDPPVPSTKHLQSNDINAVHGFEALLDDGMDDLLSASICDQI